MEPLRIENKTTMTKSFPFCFIVERGEGALIERVSLSLRRSLAQGHTDDGGERDVEDDHDKDEDNYRPRSVKKQILRVTRSERGLGSLSLLHVAPFPIGRPRKQHRRSDRWWSDVSSVSVSHCLCV